MITYLPVEHGKVASNQTRGNECRKLNSITVTLRRLSWISVSDSRRN